MQVTGLLRPLAGRTTHATKGIIGLADALATPDIVVTARRAPSLPEVILCNFLVIFM